MENIPDGQTAQDRPDIVARVWQLNLGAELKDLDEGVLGRVHARIYVVEFQKRGLPHAHILVILVEEDKPRTRQIIDKMVSAELPDKEKNPQLYETVTTCMIHGPCGAAYPNAVCMNDGKCTKGFPKPLSEVTKGNVVGYPVYRRRRRAAGVKYNCHINVEVCTAITAVKYLYKYVYKGSEKAVIAVEAVHGEGNQTQIEPNEILPFLNARYISPVEAWMRLLDHSVQGKTHAITQLSIHLENEQMVTFRSSDDPAVVVTRCKHTMLTRFFELCASEVPDNEVAQSTLYQDIPKLFRWDTKDKRWVHRKRYQAALGRMIHVSPRDMQRFYMRVLLCHRKGPTSFENLRTVDGITYDLYREAALHAGYLEDDSKWVACMTDASQFRMPYQLRQLFATIIVYSQVVEIGALWERFYDDLSLDFGYKYRSLEGNAKEEMVKFHTLKNLNDLLLTNGSAVAHFEDLPQLSEYPHLVLDSLLQNNIIRREMEGHNHDILQETVDQEHLLNDEQRSVYSAIINAVDNPTPGNTLFFIDGPGGTGKSTLLKHILAKLRLSGKIALAVALSGIASLLFMGGRTAHSTFKISLKLNDTSTCSIYKQSHLKGLIQKASLVIWDEAPMTHRHAFEAVDRSLRNLMDNDDEPFGGKVFVLSGDFRQILPVVVRGTPAQTIDACPKSSTLWPKSQQLHLRENMRVMSAQNESTATELAEFSEFLLQVGEGRHEINSALGPNCIKIPKDMLVENPVEELSGVHEDEDIRPGVIPRGLTRMVDEMYTDINNPAIANDEYFANRTILTTTNAVVQRINEAVAQRLEGVSQEYLSADSVEEDEEVNFFEQEVLHTVNINGIPPHKLTLKKGALIVMMRNLNPNLGLCSGTRLRIVELKPHVIHATIMTGERQGQHVLIPKIVFISDGGSRGFPFRLRRKQFPVQPAFAMTINKAQGQTVQNLGLYLFLAWSAVRRTVESDASVQVQGADRVPAARGGGRSVHRQHSVQADFRIGIKERYAA
ncbi:hypothetical protein PC113_g683 [Phytophthora cactorum]|uniref:ATP-dependent DNA helicase n=1 Tax=Phytophthora cactorum TaxID=29920 RepID=A0A8T1A2U4_9STRA|nr:hypothetical protein PC113_g683 [Phytophthora cactorum]